jgi:predicted amidohydrolase YtcJ
MGSIGGPRQEPGSPASGKAELVLYGGRVWGGSAQDAPGPTALAVRGGLVAALGRDDEVLALAGPRTERIALAGRMVVPGFADNHTHFVAGGFELAGVQLRDAVTPREVADRIGAFAARHPGEWMTGGGWDHERWGGELPRRDWIDALTPETPVLVSRLDQHMALANSRALALAGIGLGTADPAGGEIVRDGNGRPTGILKDEAIELAIRVMPAPSPEATDRALEAAVRHAVSLGVTHITDMGGGERSWDGLAAYRRAQAGGRLPLRAYVAVPIATADRLVSYIDREGRGDGCVRWGLVKGFVDGSLGSTTAWFREPYTDVPARAGLTITDPEVLARQIASADAAGLHVAVHAIGDRANDWLLDAYAAARRANGPRERRFRIEHAQHLTPEAIGRFGAEQVIASMQPAHAIDDGCWAERRIGPARARWAYPVRSLLDRGALVTFGSDWTVAPLSPLLGIFASVTRATTDGARPGGWVPEERITVGEALVAYTRANAYANFRDHDLGVLTPGRCADLVVLSKDLFRIPPHAIGGVGVDLTVVDGRVVYHREADG